MGVNESFKYDALPSQTSFRIFKLECGDKNLSLRGTLETYPLEKAPEYEALSYVWGPPATAGGKSMKCNGQDFIITDNLDAALRRLLLPDKSRCIWIDQICINQNDLDERSQQVSMMRDTYNKTKIVNAWLGPADSVEAASVASMLSTMASLPLWNSKDHPGCPNDEDLQRWNLPVQAALVWRSFNTMLSLPYFSRVWIIQEIVVSSAFQLLWGDVTIPGADFLSALRWTTVNDMQRSPLIQMTPHPGLNLEIAHAGVFILQNSVASRDWLRLLVLSSAHQATDPRDKIYALIGLADQTGYHVVPDYKKDTPEVFANLASKLISKSKSLDVLSYSTVEDLANAELPLWAPRWNGRPLASLEHCPFRQSFNASSGRDVMRRDTANHQLLALGGLPVDVVIDTSNQDNTRKSSFNNLDLASPQPMDLNESGAAQRVMEACNIPGLLAWFKMVTKHQEILAKRNGLHTIKKFLLTMIGSPDALCDEFYLEKFQHFVTPSLLLLLSDGNKKTECRELLYLTRLAVNASTSVTGREPLFENEEAVQWLKERLGAIYADGDEANSFLEMIQDLPTTEIRDGKLFLDSFFACTEGRRFFITHKGYMGFGPPAMQPGDHVCVLFGGSTPYVLRPTAAPDEYMFLGDCFVHGLMNGEAIAGKGQGADEDGKLPEKWFMLR